MDYVFVQNLMQFTMSNALISDYWNLSVNSNRDLKIPTTLNLFYLPDETFGCTVMPAQASVAGDGGCTGWTTAAMQAGRTRSVTICPYTTDLSRSPTSGQASPAGE